MSLIKIEMEPLYKSLLELLKPFFFYFISIQSITYNLYSRWDNTLVMFIVNENFGGGPIISFIFKSKIFFLRLLNLAKRFYMM